MSEKIGERTVKHTFIVTFTSDEVARILRREAGAPEDGNVSYVRSEGSSIYGDYEVEWTEKEETP